MQQDRNEQHVRAPARLPSGTIDGVPEFHDRRMGRTPFGFELLDLCVGEPVRLEFPPRVETTHVSKREIASFPNAAFGALLGVGTFRYSINPARGRKIGLITRIVRGIKATVTV